jgi:hypothetical protein
VRQAFDVEAHNETKHASKLMARLYAAMEKAYPTSVDPKVRPRDLRDPRPHPVPDVRRRHRDVAPNLFQDFILEHTATDGSDIGPKLTACSPTSTPRSPRTGERTGFDGFRYVNGGIFTERVTLPAFSTPSSVLRAGRVRP